MVFMKIGTGIEYNSDFETKDIKVLVFVLSRRVFPVLDRKKTYTYSGVIISSFNKAL